MQQKNVGAINYGSGNVTVSGTVVGDNGTVNFAFPTAPARTLEDYLAKLEAIRAGLYNQAAQGQPDVALDDAIAALGWLRQHHADRTKPADADQRFTALKRLQPIWTYLVETVKQLPGGVIAGWIVEVMK